MRRLILASALLLTVAASPNPPAPVFSLDNSTALPTGANTAQTLASLAAQQGVLLDAFKLAADPDYTLAMGRAVAAQVPILLGPKTYIVNNFSTGAVTNFVLRGVKGSVIQRTSASGSNFFTIGATNVVIDGVTFDMNKAAVTANQWPVLMSAGGQNISIHNSVFKNNSGTLGACLAITGTGPAAGGSLDITDSEFTGCTALAGLYIGSVSNGVVARNYVHDNSTIGVFAGSYLTASATNYLSNLIISNNQIFRNNSGVQVGGFSPPYAYGTPAAVSVQVLGNHFQDNGSYQLTLQGDYLTAIGNLIDQSSAAPSLTGAVDCNSRYSTINDNTVNLTNASFGIDCGSSVQNIVNGNQVTLTGGTAINASANSFSTFSNNVIYISGNSIGIHCDAVDTDGSLRALPTTASGITITDNTIYISGSTPNGIDVINDAGGFPSGVAKISVRRNRFFVSGAGSGSSQDIIWWGSASSVDIGDNQHNGSSVAFIDPNASGDVLFDNVYLGGTIYGVSSTTNIRSLETSQINTYGAGGSILWVYPSSGGAGYTSATTLSASGGAGTGFAATPLINNGVIIGVRVTNFGSGYSGTITVTATDTGGGTGATFTVGNTPTLPAYARLTYISAATHLFQKSGGYVALQGSPLMLTSGTSTILQAVIGGLFWNVLSSPLPSIAVGSLPTCSSAANGATANVTGSVTNKWQAQCNGTNWLWPDATTVTN